MRWRIKELLQTVDINGFTVMLHGTHKRYVVGLTNNTEWTVQSLAQQYRDYFGAYDNISIGGRKDHKTNTVYIDIGTTTDDLLQARMLMKLHNQQCIRDSQNQVEVY